MDNIPPYQPDQTWKLLPDPSLPQRTPHKRGGFEPIPKGEWPAPCLDPEHQPPMHLYIPPGQQFRHVCPTCGAERVMRGSNVTCSAVRP